jgi:hypothetical protein
MSATIEAIEEFVQLLKIDNAEYDESMEDMLNLQVLIAKNTAKIYNQNSTEDYGKRKAKHQHRHSALRAKSY